VFGPTLKGSNVELAPVAPGDLPLINRWWALPEVNRFWAGIGVPSLRRTEEWYERSARSDEVIIWSVRGAGRTIGHTFLVVSWRHRRAWSGLLIGESDMWGAGYGSEAVRLRTQYAFRELGLERLESESVDENVGMHRALQKSGYRVIGRKRHVFYRGGRWHDSLLFELLREDWDGEGHEPDVLMGE
jgi:RimJ/RimL family protein N-acetyltransferase